MQLLCKYMSSFVLMWKWAMWMQNHQPMEMFLLIFSRASNILISLESVSCMLSIIYNITFKTYLLQYFQEVHSLYEGGKS